MVASALLLAVAAVESLCIAPSSDIALCDAGLELSASVIRPGWVMTVADGRVARAKASLMNLENGVADVDFRILPVTQEPVEVQQLVLRGVFKCEGYAGGRYEVDGTRASLPRTLEKGHLFRGEVSRFAVWDVSGRLRFCLDFSKPVTLLLQDERHWRRDEFEFRVVFGEQFKMRQGTEYGCRFKVSSELPIALAPAPPPMQADANWIPLADDTLSVRPGSALDFSGFRPTVGKAGDLGRVIATNGHFAFERDASRPIRFFGVNVCSEAAALSEDRSEAFATMLARRGYNAVRFHHQDAALTTRAWDGTLDPVRMRRFDALVKALVDHGIWFTLDFQVTRRMSWQACGIDRPGLIDKYDAKRLIVIDERVFGNYVSFVKGFLTHVNPLTGRDYAHEPALFGVSLVNELDPGKITAEQERRFVLRMKSLLKDLGCSALVTDLNLGRKFGDDMQKVRQECLDYADTHVYVRHPKFATADKRGGLRQDASNPLMDRIPRLMPDAGQRLDGKPSVITEWNWPAPSPWRAASGLVTGSAAAHDGWDGLWRFAWSHSGEGASGVKPLGCFDIAGDPVNRLADYATAALFARGDGDTSRIDRTNGAWRVVSSRTCAVATTKGTFAADVLSGSLDSPGAVWVSSLDGLALRESKRMVVFHLTDARMTGQAYADVFGSLLTEWGKRPVLVRRGVASLSLALGNSAWTVTALGIDGSRVQGVPCSVQNGRLSFVADTAGVPGRATMAYEIGRK